MRLLAWPVRRPRLGYLVTRSCALAQEGGGARDKRNALCRTAA
ncbi:hypothetical protein ACRAWF_38345 [Streptomyces sp. L7]